MQYLKYLRYKNFQGIKNYSKPIEFVVFEFWLVKAYPNLFKAGAREEMLKNWGISENGLSPSSDLISYKELIEKTKKKLDIL